MMYYRMILGKDTSDIDGSEFTGIIRAYFLAFQVVYLVFHFIDCFLAEIE